MRVFIVIIALFSISSCKISTMEISAGAKACKPYEMREVMRNISNLGQIQIGTHRDYVTELLGKPDNFSTFAIKDGSYREALFYKVKAGNCRVGHSFAFDYEPIFFKRNHVVGKGHDYYRNTIAPMESIYRLSSRSNEPKISQFDGWLLD